MTVTHQGELFMNRLISLILILFFALLTSCGDNTDPVKPAPELTPEEIIIQNCHIIKTAADAFMEENDGKYALFLTDTSLAGHTMKNLLPGGELLLNPTTGLKTEPRQIDFTFEYGQIRYMPTMIGGIVVGYLIDSFSGHGEWLCALFSHTEEYWNEEMGVVVQCFTLERKAIEFAENNNGVFPRDIDTDQDQSGHTIQWYWLMTDYDNPFTEAFTNPVNGTAGSPGEVGYRPVLANNIPVGYIITGYGAYELIKERSDIPVIEY
jgi:hypothetical protein